MRHAEFIAQYDVPIRDPAAARPALAWSRRGEGRARSLVGAARRRMRGPRLAYLDGHFPWRRSGFRYADALALHEARPDTVFFSMYEMRDPFPAPVLPLAQFPRLAPTLGVTDVYGVFLDFMAGVLGLRHGGEPGPIEGLDLSGVLRQHGIRAHAGLLPGGGFAGTEAGLAEARRLVDAADQVFSWAPVALERLAGVVPITPAVIDTRFYVREPHDFAARPLNLLFAADAKPRKGLAVALAALEALTAEPVHLHVVGPHDHAQQGADPRRTTFHGWLQPEQLRDLHRRCQVFVSPVQREDPGDPGGDGGVTDGFPTAAAGEAVSSGCLLITANPDADHRVLRPGVDHVESAADPAAVADAVRTVLANPGRAARVATSGSRRVRERLDVRAGAGERLALMGLEPARGDRRARRASRAQPGPSRAEMTVPSDLADQVDAIGASVESLRRELREVRSSLMAVGQLAVDDEPTIRRLLAAARAEPGYALPFSDPRPLVSVCIPTYTNHELLFTRAIPSALAQDHDRIEVVVVGDTAPADTAEGITRLGDPRVRFENLNVRGPYPDDPRARWFVAGTKPLNRAMELAEGSWIAILNDDDALRPDHVSTLLAAARASRDEVVYGRLTQHAPDGTTVEIGSFPPSNHAFGWQLALQHRAMRLFEYEFASAVFDEPGDWNRARRMLRAGVRFSMVDAIVCDYYPSTLWRPG